MSIVNIYKNISESKEDKNDLRNCVCQYIVCSMHNATWLTKYYPNIRAPYLMNARIEVIYNEYGPDIIFINDKKFKFASFDTNCYKGENLFNFNLSLENIAEIEGIESIAMDLYSIAYPEDICYGYSSYMLDLNQFAKKNPNIKVMLY